MSGREIDSYYILTDEDEKHLQEYCKSHDVNCQNKEGEFCLFRYPSPEKRMFDPINKNTWCELTDEHGHQPKVGFRLWKRDGFYKTKDGLILKSVGHFEDIRARQDKED